MARDEIIVSAAALVPSRLFWKAAGGQEVTWGLPLSFFAERHLLSLPDLGPRRLKMFRSKWNLKIPLWLPSCFHVRLSTIASAAGGDRGRTGRCGPHLFLGVLCQQEGGWRREEQCGDRSGEVHLCCK